MDDTVPTLVPILAVTLGLGLATFFVVTTTSFIKIAVVFFIVRNAVGVQQTPPNIVLYGIALALSAFVMAPLVSEIAEIASGLGGDAQSFAFWQRGIALAKAPLEEFLTRFTSPEGRQFFVAATAQVWPEETAPVVAETSLSVLIPAFLTTELQRAFEIGFLLYLPFVVIDLVVTTILMAMGMSMVTPNIISTPMKLFLFVAVDGWTKLVEGLVMTYAA